MVFDAVYEAGYCNPGCHHNSLTPDSRPGSHLRFSRFIIILFSVLSGCGFLWIVQQDETIPKSLSFPSDMKTNKKSLICIVLQNAHSSVWFFLNSTVKKRYCTGDKYKWNADRGAMLYMNEPVNEWMIRYIYNGLSGMAREMQTLCWIIITLAGIHCDGFSQWSASVAWQKRGSSPWFSRKRVANSKKVKSRFLFDDKLWAAS